MLGQMCSKGIDKLRSLTNEESRVRKSMEQACWGSVFGTTNRSDGLVAASTIASARCGTCFHRDCASGQFRKEGDHMAARQFPAQDHTSIASRGMNLKHALRKVQADNANFLHRCPLSDVLANITLAHYDAVGRGIHMG
jgi:hypothetical protein